MSKKHGATGSTRTEKQKVLYAAWNNMLTRCLNPNQFYRYGGRGITVCEQWKYFAEFWNDMESTWSLGLSIDRINNDGNYEPHNCRWATRAEQDKNKCVRSDSRDL
jgi:hypothetical protein